MCFHAYLFDIESTLVDMQLVFFFFLTLFRRIAFHGRNLSHPKLTKTVADKCGIELYISPFSAKISLSIAYYKGGKEGNKKLKCFRNKSDYFFM